MFHVVNYCFIMIDGFIEINSLKYRLICMNTMWLLHCKVLIFDTIRHRNEWCIHSQSREVHRM